MAKHQPLIHPTYHHDIGPHDPSPPISTLFYTIDALHHFALLFSGSHLSLLACSVLIAESLTSSRRACQPDTAPSDQKAASQTQPCRPKGLPARHSPIDRKAGPHLPGPHLCIELPPQWHLQSFSLGLGCCPCHRLSINLTVVVCMALPQQIAAVLGPSDLTLQRLLVPSIRG